MELWGGGGVKQTTLYSGTDKVNTNTTYTISETLTQSSYDYLIAQVTGFNSNQSFATSGTLILQWESNRSTPSWYGAYSFDEHRSNTMNGVILVEGNTIKFYPNTASSKVSFQCISSVIGIKYIDTDIKNATSLDETILYSGNDPITATTGSTAYTLNDDITNFDYILIEVVGVQTVATATNYTISTASSQALSSSVVCYNFATGEHRGDVYTAYFDGWVSCNSDFGGSNTKIAFGFRGKSNNIASVTLKSVIGIKKNSLSTADIAEMAMPSDVYVNLNRGTGTNFNFSYTAPANGWICWMDNPKSSNSFMRIECNHNGLYKTGNTHYGNFNTDCIVSCAIAKGDTVSFYGGGLTYNTYSTIRFFYSVGDAKALGLL